MTSEERRRAAAKHFAKDGKVPVLRGKHIVRELPPPRETTRVPHGYGTSLKDLGWLTMTSAPRGIEHQILLCCPSFSDDGKWMVNQGCYLFGLGHDKAVPTHLSVENHNEQIHANRAAQEAIDAGEKSARIYTPPGLHFLMAGWYVTFTTRITHGGTGHQGDSHKPVQHRVCPIAWMPLPDGPTKAQRVPKSIARDLSML